MHFLKIIKIFVKGFDFMKKIIFTLICGLLLFSCNFKREKNKSNFENNAFISKVNDSSSYKLRMSEKSFKIIDSVVKSSFIVDYQNFNGTETIWDINVREKGVINLYFSAKISDGRIKGVLINPNNIVSHVFSQDIRDGIAISLSKGNYRIKLVGEDFYGKSTMTLIGEGDIDVRINDK